ncbi:IQ calmodulin-binding motif family protein [Histomonas meleagridis]|uniref:IQ calmodulin-binding motif family protein n=1 Tax=Histomonas meleagridis TaxID=135588 RepID=UPI00355A077B|nr:IQ calmodulin-binding motif family protein [Histomonas meleagridis]KAH0804185.1 IQ calmodulin-binding motif family protein [Histomonas meleagridis]
MTDPNSSDFNIPDDLDKFMERPSQRTVTVLRPDGPVEIKVDIEYNLPEHKPFLGGYKNRVTGIEYHHVAGQTALLPHQRGLDKLVDKAHRACQTQITANSDSQTVREFSCQTPFYHQFVNDNYPTLEAGSYRLAKEELAIREASALKIQRVTRGHFARQLVSKMKLELEEEKKQMEIQEKKVQEEIEHKRNVEIQKRIHPRTAADFKTLYDELSTWHIQETEAINNGNYTEEERKRLLKELLAKETELLHTIDKMKIEAKKQNTEQNNFKKLDTISKKKMWQLTNGEIIKVKTPNTKRAKELRNLYDALRSQGMSVDERISILLLLKLTVKEFNCQLTQELITLIDREADLLNRGRNENTLKGLRKRIETLFLQFAMNPEFNPEAAVFQEIPVVADENE